METTDLKVQMENVRLDALQFFLAEKEKTTPQKELEKMLTGMYEKYVPAETRRYLDSKLKPSALAKPRPKRPAPKIQKEEVSSHEQPGDNSLDR